MTGIREFRISVAELPFRKPFRHAAAVRESSSSVFLKCIAEDGSVGFGETLPREYVTGESRESVTVLLADKIVPRLAGMKFSSLDDVIAFLGDCNGRAPPEWVDPAIPQTAAWCAVDLALLDTFSRAFRTELQLGNGGPFPPAFRYSTVVSGDGGRAFLCSLVKMKLYGFRSVKLKIGDANDIEACRIARAVLGNKCDIRVDANMAWTVAEAARNMAKIREFGIRLFESPIAPDDMEGLAFLAGQTGGVMIDEGFHDRESLDRFIARKACNAVNVRIAKCGGLVAALARCREAMAAGLTVQVGCQTGESSLLSAAHLRLLQACGTVRYGEGCYGTHLLSEDPVRPVLQFGYGGKPPQIPGGYGFGVTVDEEMLAKWTINTSALAAAPRRRA